MSPVVRDATTEDLEWVKFYNKHIQEIGQYFIDSADKYSNIFTAVITIYILLLTFFGLASGNVLKIVGFPISLVFMIPIVFWIIGMYFFFRVKQPFFTSCSPDSPSDIRDAFTEANAEKGRNYWKGLLCFGIGILCMIIPLVFGLYIVTIPEPTTPAGDVQLIIGNDHVQYINQIPIEFTPGTNKTTVVSLLRTTSTGYQVKLQNGNVIELNKSWVEIIIRM